MHQYLPKGTDLSVYSQEQLDAIAERLNQRHRAIHGYFLPISVYRARMGRLNYHERRSLTSVAIDNGLCLILQIT